MTRKKAEHDKAPEPVNTHPPNAAGQCVHITHVYLGANNRNNQAADSIAVGANFNNSPGGGKVEAIMLDTLANLHVLIAGGGWITVKSWITAVHRK